MASASINLVFDRFKPDGGTERLALNTLQALAGESVDIAVCARDWRGPLRDDVAFVRCKPLPLGRAWRMRRFVSMALPRLRARGGLIQAHIMFPGADIYRADGGAHAQWLAQRRRIQLPLRQAYDAATPYHRTKLAMEAEMFAHPDLRSVICNSEMVREDIRHHYPECRAQLLLVEPGIDLAHFRVPKPEHARRQARASLKMPEDAAIFLFIGAGFERKGLGTAIHALAACRDRSARLAVIGKDRDSKYYARLAQRLGVSQRVHFAGAVDDVKPWLQAGNALVHPALYEPFGLVIAEAMAAGLPVLSSPTTGAARAMIRQGETGWLADALDVGAYAEALDELLGRSSEQIAAQRAACEAGAAHYSLERMRDDLMQHYQQLFAATETAA